MRRRLWQPMLQQSYGGRGALPTLIPRRFQVDLAN